MLARCLAVLFLLLASCSDDPNTPEAPDTVIDKIMDAGVDSGRFDAGRVTRDASHDSSRPPPQIPKQCEPGRYEGTFACLIVVAPWLGKIDFELVQNEMGAGEFTTLSTAAGTKISSDVDSMGGQFTGDLVATFDCQTGELKGELQNGIYLLGGIMPWRFGGPLEGSYGTDDAGVPSFTGTMGTLTTPDLWFYGPLGPSAMCEWNASRVSDDVDAGP